MPVILQYIRLKIIKKKTHKINTGSSRYKHFTKEGLPFFCKYRQKGTFGKIIEK